MMMFVRFLNVFSVQGFEQQRHHVGAGQCVLSDEEADGAVRMKRHTKPAHALVNLLPSMIALVSRPVRHLNTSSLLCDCQLKWFSPWVAEHAFHPLVNASCAHPHLLKGKSVFAVAQDEFVCGEWASMTFS